MYHCIYIAELSIKIKNGTGTIFSNISCVSAMAQCKVGKRLEAFTKFITIFSAVLKCDGYHATCPLLFRV